MTTRPDPDRLISAWLNDEAAERAPERLLSATRTRIESTNQRRALRPAWRLQTMNNRVLGGAVAAIAVIVVLGFVLIPRPAGTGGGVTPAPVPSPSPSQVPSPAATSSPAASLAVIPPGELCPESGTCLTGPLEAGTYSFAAGGVTPAKVTFTVPDGWDTDQGFVRKNFDPNPPTPVEDSPNELIFSTWVVDHVFTDACHWQSTMVSAGTTPGQLTSILAAQKGRTVSAPTGATIGAYPAQRIQFTVPASFDMAKCDNGVLHIWPDPGGDSSGGLCCQAAGSTDVVYVVNVAGQTFVVLARHAAGTSPADLAQLNAILASIVISPPPATPTPSGASPSP